MKTYTLHFQNNHLLLENQQGLWLLDTGSQGSFGRGLCELDGDTHVPAENLMGLTIDEVNRITGLSCEGLIGADILQNYAIIFDLKDYKIHFGDTDTPEIDGEAQYFQEFMGIPNTKITVEDQEMNVFFDTGAQLSYMHHPIKSKYAIEGTATDFYPGTGQFDTPIRHIPIQIGNILQTIRCGELPGVYGMVLHLTGVSGILGNEIMRKRITGYYPSQKKLILQS